MSVIKHLLQHHLERAKRGIQYNAIADCHAKGMDSIVLHEEPGNRVRMYVANHWHELHENRSGPFSVAIHAHHCDIRLLGLHGDAFSDVYALTPHKGGDFAEMRYTSGVTGDSSLTPTGRRAYAHRLKSDPLLGHAAMRAHQLHTVFVPMFKEAAWLVVEGTEDEKYESVCWTNNIKPFDPSGLYKPMNQADIVNRFEVAIRRLAE